MADNAQAQIDEAVKRFDESYQAHKPFIAAYERGERAYRGVLDAKPHKWKHQLRPRYGFNLIETVVNTTIEQGLTFDVRPNPKINMTLDEARDMLDKAEIVGQLLRHEHRVDDMDAKQRPFFLCDAIGGMGVMRTGWNYREGMTRKQVVKMQDVYDDQGTAYGQVPVVSLEDQETVLADHSTAEVVDPRDFIVHESAKALQPYEYGGAQYLHERCWYSYEQLMMWQRAGYVQNVEKLKDSRQQNEYKDRETEIWKIDKTKDLIEVLHYWCFRDGHVYRTLIGNRSVLLRAEERNPFAHGEYPYVTTSSMPAPFSLRGFSTVELIQDIQEILWEVGNQRLDNMELINNAITLIRSDVDDPDAFEYYPGARWEVDSVDQVAPFSPPYQIAQISLETESLLKGDLQNVTGAAPFASGTDTATVDQKTATGASIVMGAAQRHLAAKKYQAQMGLQREAWQRLKNCQQFINDKRLVHIVGDQGKIDFDEIDPIEFQGEFIAELEAISESELRQEKRAEATQLAQVMAGMAPLMAASQTPLNMKEVVIWLLKRWDVADAERFFVPDQQPAVAAMGAGGGGGAPPGPGGGINVGGDPNLGITAETAVDASKPSATGGQSLSPELFQQRAAALAGGPGGGAANG